MLLCRGEAFLLSAEYIREIEDGTVFFGQHPKFEVWVPLIIGTLVHFISGGER